MFWRSGFCSLPVSGFDLCPALSLSDLFFGVHQGEVLYGVQRYPVDGLIPRVVQIEGTGVGLVVV